MKVEEIKEDETYIGKDGSYRKVENIFYSKNGRPYDRLKWSTDTGKYGECYVTTFAAWAKNIK